MQEENIKKPRKTIPPFIGIAIIVIVAVVLFGGVFEWQYFSVPETPVAIQPQTIQNQTAGWKMYTNTQYGFSFQYPTNFGDLSYTQGSLSLDQGNYGNIIIFYPRILGNPPNYPDTFSDLRVRFSGKGYDESNVIIGGIQGIKVSSPQIGDTVYVPLSDNKIIEIDGNFKNPVFTKILSTFKFMAPVDQTAQPSIIVTSPNGGEQWRIGETHNITWKSNGVGASDVVLVKLVKNNPSADWYLFPAVPASTLLALAGSYTWTIPSSIVENLSAAIDYKIEILDANNASITDSSDNYFSLVAPVVNKYNPVSITSPTSGTAPLTVQFSPGGCAANIQIDYGDGTSCTTADPDGSENCDVFTHTYKNPGVYKAKESCYMGGGTVDIIITVTPMTGNATVTEKANSVNPTKKTVITASGKEVIIDSNTVVKCSGNICALNDVCLPSFKSPDGSCYGYSFSLNVTYSLKNNSYYATGLLWTPQ